MSNANISQNETICKITEELSKLKLYYENASANYDKSKKAAEEEHAKYMCLLNEMRKFNLHYEQKKMKHQEQLTKEQTRSNEMQKQLTEEQTKSKELQKQLTIITNQLTDLKSQHAIQLEKMLDLEKKLSQKDSKPSALNENTTLIRQSLFPNPNSSRIPYHHQTPFNFIPK